MAPGNASDSFGTRDRLTVDDTAYQIYRLDRVDGSARLPYSLKVLLKSLLRDEDGRLVATMCGPSDLVVCVVRAGFFWARYYSCVVSFTQAVLLNA